MTDTKPGVRIAVKDDPAFAAGIEANLLAALRSALPQASNERFALTAHAPDGTLAGGLTAATSYGWLLVKTLWVAEAYRRRGIGAALISEAEARGRALGCHGAWLDTSSPDAMRFYAGLGYAAFGELANRPGDVTPGHRRWFMQKRL